MTLAHGLGTSSFVHAVPVSTATLLIDAPAAFFARLLCSAVFIADWRLDPSWTTASLGASAGSARSKSTSKAFFMAAADDASEGRVVVVVVGAEALLQAARARPTNTTPQTEPNPRRANRSSRAESRASDLGFVCVNGVAGRGRSVL